MRAEINKFGEEIAEIFTELSDIEKTIQSELKRHTELSSKLADTFNSIKVSLEKKFELPICEATTVATTEAEEAARRKRFRNLGDVAVLAESIETRIENSAKNNRWTPSNLPPRITYQENKGEYEYKDIEQGWSFTLPEGYRLLAIGEKWVEGDEYIDRTGSWKRIETRSQQVTPTTFPIRRKI
jgi:hypothetical protein